MAADYVTSDELSPRTGCTAWPQLLSCRNAVAAAVVYGESQRVLFDVYRFGLYDVLKLPCPRLSGNEERPLGLQISELLWRGSGQPRPYFFVPGTTSAPVRPVGTE
jgi:hypothetical protein